MTKLLPTGNGDGQWAGEHGWAEQQHNENKKMFKKNKKKGESGTTQREPKLKFKRFPGKRDPNNYTAGSTMIWQQEAKWDTF